MNIFKAKNNCPKISIDGEEKKPEALPGVSREQVDAWTANIQKNIQREMSSFHKILPQLLKDQPGKFVAISDGKLVGTDSNEYDLVQRVSKENGGRFVLIQEVVSHVNKYSQSRL